MRKKLNLVFCLLLISTLPLIYLFWNSRSSLRIKNDFNRTFVNNITVREKIDLKEDGFYFAGWMKGSLYLGKSTRPFELLAIDSSYRHRIPLHPLSESIRYGRTEIDSPFFYVSDLSTFFIYRGSVSNWILSDTIHRGKLFSENLSIGSSIILRDLNTDGTEYLLSKEESGVAKSAPDLIQKQHEGLFSTDGMLLYDRDNKLLSYIYFYRNEFFTADTTLLLIERGHTIDTVSKANIKVATLTASHSITLGSPPHIVNRDAAVYRGNLFVSSNLIADNESLSSFRESEVIDVYNVPGGNYLYSFYVPRIGNNRIGHFTIKNNLLYVIQGTYLSIYDLRGQTSI